MLQSPHGGLQSFLLKNINHFGINSNKAWWTGGNVLSWFKAFTLWFWSGSTSSGNDYWKVFPSTLHRVYSFFTRGQLQNGWWYVLYTVSVWTNDLPTLSWWCLSFLTVLMNLTLILPLGMSCFHRWYLCPLCTRIQAITWISLLVSLLTHDTQWASEKLQVLFYSYWLTCNRVSRKDSICYYDFWWYKCANYQAFGVELLLRNGTISSENTKAGFFYFPILFMCSLGEDLCSIYAKHISVTFGVDCTCLFSFSGKSSLSSWQWCKACIRPKW